MIYVQSYPIDIWSISLQSPFDRLWTTLTRILLTSGVNGESGIHEVPRGNEIVSIVAFVERDGEEMSEGLETCLVQQLLLLQHLKVEERRMEKR